MICIFKYTEIQASSKIILKGKAVIVRQYVSSQESLSFSPSGPSGSLCLPSHPVHQPRSPYHSLPLRIIGLIRLIGLILPSPYHKFSSKTALRKPSFGCFSLILHPLIKCQPDSGGCPTITKRTKHPDNEDSLRCRIGSKT